MNEQKIKLFFRDALVVAFGVLFAAWILGPSHIEYKSFLSLFVVAMLISFLNAFLRPLLFSSLIPILLTAFGLGATGVRILLNPRSIFGVILAYGIAMGLGIWFINACIFSLASFFAGSSFVVHGFGSAMLGSIFTSLATLLICAFFGIKRENGIGSLFQSHIRKNTQAGTPPPQPPPRPASRQRREREDDDDVIDI